MSKHGSALLRSDEGSTRLDASSPAPRRINVAVNGDMVAAIERVVEREHVSLTEAVRRLIMYGDFVSKAVKDDRAALIIRAPEGQEREIILV